jgi:hypothetical protein
MPKNASYTPTPRLSGIVVLGNGTAAYPNRLVRSFGIANRIKQRFFARSAGSVTAVLVPVLADGTTSGNAAAKTFLQTQSIKQLKGGRVTSDAAKRLRT